MSENLKPESLCQICGGRVFTTCLGCGIAVCEKCSCFELIGSGCGSVWSVYYCPTCVRDPCVNPNAVLRD